MSFFGALGALFSRGYGDSDDGITLQEAVERILEAGGALTFRPRAGGVFSLDRDTRGHFVLVRLDTVIKPQVFSASDAAAKMVITWFGRECVVRAVAAYHETVAPPPFEAEAHEDRKGRLPRLPVSRDSLTSRPMPTRMAPAWMMRQSVQPSTGVSVTRHLTKK